MECGNDTETVWRGIWSFDTFRQRMRMARRRARSPEKGTIQSKACKAVYSRSVRDEMTRGHMPWLPSN